MAEAIDMEVVFGMESTEDTIVAQLAVALSCLPSQIRDEDYEDIQAIISVLNSQHRKQEKQLKKSKHGRRSKTS